MSDTSAPATPWHLWVVGGLSLLWNAGGAYDYLMTQTQNEAYMSAFTPEQLEFFYAFPTWVVAFWALAIWGSVLGSILLLLKKKLAVQVFIVALVGLAMTTLHNWVLSNGLEVMGDAFSIIFSVAIIVVSILLFIYAKKQAAAGVLT